jgi:phosphonate transport system ATP-binding protein
MTRPLPKCAWRTTLPTPKRGWGAREPLSVIAGDCSADRRRGAAALATDVGVHIRVAVEDDRHRTFTGLSSARHGRPVALTTVMSHTTSPTVRLDRVTVSFGAKRALDRVSATIGPGEFVAIVGRSGAGKTTLLRALCRALTVTDGTIRFGAQDLAMLTGAALRRHRTRVGMIYQQFNLVRRLRVIDNVLVGRLGHLSGIWQWAALARRFDASDRRIALRCLDHVGLLDRVWQRTDTLSGGEQQRVAIAKVLAQAPALILGDEPVASLDVRNGSLVMDTLRRVATDTGLTVIATLHHVEYARRYADRVLGLRDGRLVFDGSTADLTDAALRDIFGDAPPEPGDTVVVPFTERRLVAVS